MKPIQGFSPFAMTLAAALTAGCSLQPAYERPDSSVDAAYPTGAAYDRQPGATAPDGGARSSNGKAAIDIGWRDFFIDARLQSVIEIALQNNRDLRVSMLNVEAARAQYQITRAELSPWVDAGASSTRERTPSNLSTGGSTSSTVYSVGANVAWELDLFGRVQSLKDEALAQYLSLAETRKAAEIALISQVAIQYLTMLGEEDQLAVTQATLKNAEESFRITKLSFDNGIATELDLQQSQGILEQASATLEAYSRARAQDENALVMLIGQALPDDLPAGKALSQQNLLTDVPAGLPSELLQRRPDIAAAEQSLLAANAYIGAARAAFFPSISLTGSFGTLSPSTSGLFSGGQGAWSFVPQITVPIFRGGANRANLELAQVQKRIEIARYEKAIQTAFREVADGLAARGTYDRQIQSLQRYETTQMRRLELSNMRYRSGVDDYLSVLQAQTDLFEAQQSLVSAKVARANNLVTLYKSLGGGWSVLLTNLGAPQQASQHLTSS
ncbi:efflux transporter outer membrane subunit [Pseudomonas pergaminensis]|jgi:multidrug efflux system outer membrane protein